MNPKCATVIAVAALALASAAPATAQSAYPGVSGLALQVTASGAKALPNLDAAAGRIKPDICLSHDHDNNFGNGLHEHDHDCIGQPDVAQNQAFEV